MIRGKTGLENELARGLEVVHDGLDRLGIEVGATNLPGGVGDDLLFGKQLRCHQAPDGGGAHLTVAGRLILIENLRVRNRSLLPSDPVIAACRLHSGLVPMFALPRAVTETVENTSDLIVAIALAHPPQDLQNLHRRTMS